MWWYTIPCPIIVDILILLFSLHSCYGSGVSFNTWSISYFCNCCSVYILFYNWPSCNQILTEKSTLVRVMAWCHQAASHYLNQCWPRTMSLYVTIGNKENSVFSFLPDVCIYEALLWRYPLFSETHWKGNGMFIKSVTGYSESYHFDNFQW